MKKWIGFIALSLLLQGMAWGQLIDAKSVEGKISNQKENSVTIKHNGRNLILDLTRETQIFRGPEFATLKDLRTGDQVRAVYREKGQKKTAVMIIIITKR